jgi:hypothetical protein
MNSSVYNADRATHLRIIAVVTSAGMIQKAEISKNEAIAASTVRKWL